MSKGLVLVTGANGYIAGPTIEAFLKAGYSVRGTVRSLPGADALKNALADYGSKLEIVQVPDITLDGAFDEAVRGCTAIAHLAAPVSLNFKDPKPVMHGAVQGTLSILRSAAKEPLVKSFVLLSSVAAISRLTKGPHKVTEEDWNDWAEAMVEQKGTDTPGPVIYSASKTAAERAFWKFGKESNVGFSMTSVNPSFVSGPPVVKPKTENDLGGTVAFIWKIFFGSDLDKAGQTGTSAYVDVRDVARLILFAVENTSVANGQRYLASAGWAGFQAVADILRKAYPERQDVIQEGKPGEGYQPDFSFPAENAHDTSKAIGATGQAWIPFNQTVLDTAKLFDGKNKE